MWVTVAFCASGFGLGRGVCTKGLYRLELDPTHGMEQIQAGRLFLSCSSTVAITLRKG